eukprot:1159788-Pelagomonas_calceolata.AAC.1
MKEKRTPTAEAPCIPSTNLKRNKRKKSVRIRRVTSSSSFLILVTRVERSLLKSASCASNVISVLTGQRMSMKLQSKVGGCMSVKTKLLKGLESVRGVDDPTHT